MSVRTSPRSPLRLTLPGAAIKRLREAAIYCTPEISLEIPACRQAVCSPRS